MTAIAGTDSSNVYASLGLTSSTPTNTNGSDSALSATNAMLNEQDFLKLMTVQLKDQNPLQPISNSEFYSQIAQFSTVAGIDKLNQTFTSLSSQLTSSQSLQAASLIGHGVLVQGSNAQLTSSGLFGAVEVPSSGDVKVQIKDASGAVVSTLDLGTQASGTLPFSWNGTDASGNVLPTGAYSISATVSSGSGELAATTDVAAEVQSVSIGSSGLVLNLQGLGPTPFSQVKQII
jgi:flagellar basal-body rod modification protein FlgD